MSVTNSHKLIGLLLLCWLACSQVLVLAHDATHEFHDHTIECDNFAAASGNHFALLTDFQLPQYIPPVNLEAVPLPSCNVARCLPQYQARAPPRSV